MLVESIAWSLAIYGVTALAEFRVRAGSLYFDQAPLVGIGLVTTLVLFSGLVGLAGWLLRSFENDWRMRFIVCDRPLGDQTQGVEAQAGLGDGGRGVLALLAGQGEFLVSDGVVEFLEVDEALEFGGKGSGGAGGEGGDQGAAGFVGSFGGGLEHGFQQTPPPRRPARPPLHRSQTLPSKRKDRAYFAAPTSPARYATKSAIAAGVIAASSPSGIKERPELTSSRTSFRKITCSAPSSPRSVMLLPASATSIPASERPSSSVAEYIM